MSKASSYNKGSGYIGGDLTVAGNLTLKGSSVLGGAGVVTTLAASGAVTFSTTLAVTGAATLSSTLAVTGAVTMASTLGVTGVTTLTGGAVMGDAKNIAIATTTGTKIGTGTTQKIGFWNATPVVQQVLATGASHTVDDIITMLQTLGLCKQS